MAQIGIDEVHECRTAHSRQPLRELRIVQEGFESAAEVEKFITDFYFARGVIHPPQFRALKRTSEQEMVLVSIRRGFGT
jgi:hypothetical protein